jgi:hypothetical protein
MVSDHQRRVADEIAPFDNCLSELLPNPPFQPMPLRVSEIGAILVVTIG